MADTTNDVELTEYSTETPASAGLGEAVAGGRGQSLTAPVSYTHLTLPTKA